jgi:hypothetical protein
MLHVKVLSKGFTNFHHFYLQHHKLLDNLDCNSLQLSWSCLALLQSVSKIRPRQMTLEEKG